MKPKPAQLSSAQYLELEVESSIKHEYVDGEVYAMSGASRRHNLLATNLLRRAANAAAEHDGRQVFGSDMRIQIQARNCFYYPDVSACCDPNDRHELYVTSPCLIIEVLSPSTASIDRESRGWGGYILNQPDDLVELSCLGLRLTLGEIYEGIELPSGIAEPEPAEYAAGLERSFTESGAPPN
jgi:Uma2 family endonuclease